MGKELPVYASLGFSNAYWQLISYALEGWIHPWYQSHLSVYTRINQKQPPPKDNGKYFIHSFLLFHLFDVFHFVQALWYTCWHKFPINLAAFCRSFCAVTQLHFTYILLVPKQPLSKAMKRESIRSRWSLSWSTEFLTFYENEGKGKVFPVLN